MEDILAAVAKTEELTKWLKQNNPISGPRWYAATLKKNVLPLPRYLNDVNTRLRNYAHLDTPFSIEEQKLNTTRKTNADHGVFEVKSELAQYSITVSEQAIHVQWLHRIQECGVIDIKQLMTNCFLLSAIIADEEHFEIGAIFPEKWQFQLNQNDRVANTWPKKTALRRLPIPIKLSTGMTRELEQTIRIAEMFIGRSGLSLKRSELIDIGSRLENHL